MKFELPLRFVTVDMLLQALGDNITEHEAKQYKYVYKIILKNVKNFLANNDSEKDMVEFVKIEWKNYCQFCNNRERNYHKILCDVGLLSETSDCSSPNFCQYLRFPATKIDLEISQLRIFMDMKQTYERLFKVESDTSIFSDTTADSPSSEIILISENEKLVKCQQLLKNDIVNRYILDDWNYFILVNVENTLVNTAKIVKKIKVSDINPVIDSCDPMRMNLYVSNNELNTEKGNIETIVLNFTDDLICLYMKKKLEESSQRLVMHQAEELQKYFSLCEKVEKKNKFI